MPIFVYKAKKGPKEILEGKLEADSEVVAVRKLMDSGMYPVWIKEETLFSREKAKSISFLSKKIKTKDLANFTRQLSELLDSGLALFDALNIIENQIAHLQLKEIITNVKSSIKDGNTFSDSLKAYPHIFSNLYINIVRSGEAGSMLGDVLASIADFLEKQEETRSKVISAMVYPMLMLCVGVVSIFILMTFVIPRLANMFVDMGEALPLPTRMLIGMSEFIKTYWFLLALVTVGFILFIKKSGRVSKKMIDNLKLKIPIFGLLTKNTELTRFSRTLSTLLKNGVPILQSLKITSDIIDNEIIKKEVLQIYSDVKAGSSLASAIKKNPSFPPFVVNMAAVGEEGGFLDKTLSKVANSYETEADRLVKMFASLLEPIMILVIGVVVGFIVISMLLPVFQISLTAQ